MTWLFGLFITVDQQKVKKIANISEGIINPDNSKTVASLLPIRNSEKLIRANIVKR
jgi:hypothetical protein